MFFRINDYGKVCSLTRRELRRQTFYCVFSIIAFIRNRQDTVRREVVAKMMFPPPVYPHSAIHKCARLLAIWSNTVYDMAISCRRNSSKNHL